MSPAVQVLLAGLLLAVAGLFATARAALDRMTVARATRLVEQDRPGADRLVALLEDAAGTWSALTLLVVVPLVAAVALVTALLMGLLVGPAALLVAVLVMGVLGYLGVELLPRSIALRRAEAVACRTAGVVGSGSAALRPLTSVLVWLGARVLPGSADGADAFVTEEAIRDLIDEAAGQGIEPSERAMIQSIFDLGDTLVREIMVPDPDVVMVSDAQSLADVVEVILDQGFSRIPVHRAEDRDAVVGVLYAKDVLKRLHTTGSEAGAWDDLVRDAVVVPELKRVDSLLQELQAAQVHLAVVVDEYGALAGIATIEDVLEEIVGEIVDEHDAEEDMVADLPGGGWHIDARLPVTALEDLTGSDLPDEDWDTAGGLLGGLLGRVPRVGDSILIDGLRLQAERMRGRRVALIRVTPADAAAVVPDAPAAEGSRTP